MGFWEQEATNVINLREQGENMKFKLWVPVIPLILFVVIGGFLWQGLNLDQKQLPSVLVNQNIPKFLLPTLEDAQKTVNESLFSNKITVLNVWASWCSVCLEEHDAWLSIIQSFKSQDGINKDAVKRGVNGDVQFVGLNYHDDYQRAKYWLSTWGNPYLVNLYDSRGKLGMNLGVYGTPETFIIDRDGVIQYRHTGPMDESLWKEELLPIINNLK